MAQMIKRGFLIKRLYCSECNQRVSREDGLCQNCGEVLEALPIKLPKARILPAKKVAETDLVDVEERAEEETYGSEELGLEEPEPEEGFSEADEEEPSEVVAVGSPAAIPAHPRKVATKANLKTFLWIIVTGMLLWGLFKSDSMLVVGAALILVIVELEAIRGKLKGN